MESMSILDFPRLDLGAVLRPLGPDDDLLGEMLDLDKGQNEDAFVDT